MHIDQIEEARALAPKVIHSMAAADVSPALVVQYVPTYGTGGTAATAKTTTASISFTVDATTPAGVDRIGSSTGHITYASYESMGEVLDQINKRCAWRAYLVAALRADLASHMLAQAAASCIGDHGLTFYYDTSLEDSSGIAISGEKFVNNGPNGHVTDYDDECENMLLYAKVKMVSDGTLKFYSASQQADAQIGPTYTCGSASEVEVNATRPDEPFLVAKRGERLIVRVDAATAANGTPTEWRVEGKTAVLKNDRIVTEDNY